ACQPPLDVRLDYKMINQRCAEVGEQDRQHHALGERRVDHADEHHHDTDQDAEYPLAGIGHGGGNRVGGHEDHAEGEPTGHHVPVPGHGEHRVGIRAYRVEQQTQHDHADHHPGDDAPGGNLGHQQYSTTDEDGQGTGFADGALHGADEGIHPAQTAIDHGIDTTGTSHAQRRGAGEAVDRGPYRITGDLRRIGKEQERPTGQRRVEEVLAGTAEDFLADDHTKADTQRYLPQGNARRQDQGKQHRGHEETFVDFMTAHTGEENLPEAAHHEGDHIDGHEPGGPIDDVFPDSSRIEARQHGRHGD